MPTAQYPSFDLVDTVALPIFKIRSCSECGTEVGDSLGFFNASALS
jgi:hypothetical protein